MCIHIYRDLYIKITHMFTKIGYQILIQLFLKSYPGGSLFLN